MKPKTLFTTAVIAFMIITFNINGQSWNETSKLVALDRAYTDWFGWSVSISGHTAIVGAYLKDNENADINFLWDEGAAYIYDKDIHGYWEQTQKIVASDKDEFDWFGCAVGISGDYAIVGAYVEEEDANGQNTMMNAGSAYIFERDGSGQWSEVQKIVASDREINSYFGYSVAISGDYAVVGANRDDVRGAAYVYKRNEQGQWNETQKLQGDFIYGSEFGFSVAIHDSLIIVGAPYEGIESDPGVFINWEVGAAYVFQRDESDTWNRVEKLVATNREEYDHFGNSVDISGDYAIAGARWEDKDLSESDSLYRSGAVYIFERDMEKNWNSSGKIVPSDRAEMDEFGFSVSISGDMATIGAPYKDYNGADTSYFLTGATYVFQRNSSGTWEELTKLLASDKGNTDNFGNAVSISGNYAIAGAYYDLEDAEGENPIIQAGSAYIFSYCSTVENNLSENLCDGDSILLGGQYQFDSGTYYDTLRSSTGCDSVIITQLTKIVIDTAVTLTGNTLTAVETDATYQWIDCNSNQILSGENDQSFTFSGEGTYSVEIFKSGCIDTSFCHVINVLGIVANEFGPDLKIFPNPTNKYLNINLDKVYPRINVHVFNMVGKLAAEKQYDHQQGILLDLGHLPQGFYFIQLKTKEREAFIRVVKN